MCRHILSFLGSLPLALILSQQLQDDLLHLCRGVVLGKELPHLIGAEADLFTLVCFRLGEDAEDGVHAHFSGLAQLLQLDSLG